VKKILLIDDDPLVRELLSDYLTGLGYDVETAEDGRKGIAAARQLKPALVITDLMMPSQHGFDVCQEVHQDPALKGCRILIISVKHFEIDKRTALRLGADKYLVKPFTLEEFLKTVSDLVGPPEAAA
jgi:DNA-binding response OmpR family regulator